MKRPTTASLKKVTPENLAALGVERLAELLVVAAEARPDLKRRLRMELAAAQGPDHLAPEVDRRLASLETSRGKIGWRQRPAFVRDLEELRRLIAERLAALDRVAGLSRLWAFMGVARRVNARLRDKDGALAAVFDRGGDPFPLRGAKSVVSLKALPVTVEHCPAGRIGPGQHPEGRAGPPGTVSPPARMGTAR